MPRVEASTRASGGGGGGGGGGGFYTRICGRLRLPPPWAAPAQPQEALHLRCFYFRSSFSALPSIIFSEHVNHLQ